MARRHFTNFYFERQPFHSAKDRNAYYKKLRVKKYKSFIERIRRVFLGFKA